MRFTITNDSDQIIGTYISEFSNSVLKMYTEVDSNQVLIIEQPWYPAPNGERLKWESEEQAVAWFKENIGVQ